MRIKISIYTLFILITSPLMFTSACAEKNSDLIFLLSDRHHVPKASELEKQFSSRDEFIDELLKLRLTEKPPFVALRAEQMLLEYSDNSKVISSLEEDLVTDGRLGLARVIIRGLSLIKDESAKERMSRTSADLVRKDTRLKYLEDDIKKETDPVIRKAFGF
ncbi:MAG TPA: hypothetical protein PKA63_06510 [Oligoflexia bacterium]|nr:hypothetical protein [Oligoflexia bacterium]HMP48301.1 hypothetical protein [Oligoflexia bacterium]